MNYSNVQVRESQTTQEYSLGLTKNYAIVKDQPESVRLDNLTSTLEQQELVEFRYRKIPTVQHNLNIQYPSSIKGGVQYALQFEEVIRKDLPDGIPVDHPIVMYLTVRHDLSDAITNAALAEVFERLVSALRKESDNSYRFSDLMRGALRPNVD